jgi:hypothetical protein
VLENRVLRKTFGLKRLEVTGGWGKCKTGFMTVFLAKYY